MKGKQFRTLVLLAILVLVAAASAGCGGTQATETSATTAPASTTSATSSTTAAESTTTQANLEPYKLGLITSITGVMGAMGTGLRDGTLLAVDQINANGGVNGHPIEVVVYDDQSDPSKGVLAVKKLMSEDQVLAIMGPLSTGIAIAAADFAEQAQVPMFAQNSSTWSVATKPWDDLSKPPANLRKWVFKLGIEPNFFMLATYEMMKQAGDIKNIAFLGVNSAMGQGFKQAMELTVKTAGIEVVAWEQYEPNDTDMTAQLTKIKDLGVDAIYIGGAEMAGGIAYKQAREMGITVPIFGAPPLVMYQIVDSLGASLNGLRVPAYLVQFGTDCPPSDPQHDAVISVTDGIKAANGARADTGHGSGYDTALMFADVLARADPDLADVGKARGQIRDAMETVKGFVGCYCMGDMTEWHDLPAPYMPCEIQDGKLKIVGEKMLYTWNELQ